MTATATAPVNRTAIATAVLTEQDILQEAAHALAEQDRLRMQLRLLEDRVRRLCRQYDLASGTRGFAPYHLRNACEARGFLPIPRIGD